MLNEAARTGNTSNVVNLPIDSLEFVTGDRQFFPNQDGNSPPVICVLQNRSKGLTTAVNRPFEDVIPPNEDEEGLEGVSNIPMVRTWMAPGALGETTGRLTGPVQFILKLMESWRLDKGDVVRLLGYIPDDIDYVSAVLDGRGQFRRRDFRDRVAHLFCIRRTLWSLFRDLDVENEWLRERHTVLKGKSPLSLIIAGSMEDLLLAREYVESAAGVR